MDLDQLDLNPRITAAVKRGMCVVSRAHRHCGQNKLHSLHHPRLAAQSGVGWSRKGHLWHLSSQRAVAAEGELLSPHVPGSSFCHCVN